MHSNNPVIFLKDEDTKMKACDITGRKIPETFDARLEWPACRASIERINNQGNCSSCWAFAAIGVMSDRLCIQTNGKENFRFSPQDLISCCQYCDFACTGGIASRSWHYYTHFGIEGCKPYQESEYFYNKTTTCIASCENPFYNVSYKDDKHFGSEYYMVNKTPECIQAEIMEKGPVQASMAVYEDFNYYRDGVYVYTIGKKQARHAVRIIGWGKERGIPYWLVANSWGCQWANLKGFFKIRRGTDECGIEQHVIAGNPKFDSDDRVLEISRHSYVPWVVTSAVLMCFVLMTVLVGLVIILNHKAKEMLVKYLVDKN
ncbi:cathepsin B-like cysteine proteinase 4 isoform X2 [Zophobas morio]